MVQISVLFFAVSSLLATSTLAAPIPALEVGQVVHVAAEQTNGEHYEGQGASIPHPHIVLAKNDGKVVLAPVTHAPDDKNGPFITHAENFHDKLEGNVLLHHVTADENNIPANPSFNGEKVHAGAIQDINREKLRAAVNVHTSAADSHVNAAKAHTEAAEQHEKIAKMWGNNKDLVKQHLDQADAHRTEAILHYNKANTHRQNAELAQDGKPLTYHDYAKVQDNKDKAYGSMTEAELSEKHAKAAVDNLKAHAANTKAAAHAQTAAQKKELETKAFGHLIKASEHAPNSAAKPNPDQSRADAQESRSKAKQLIPNKKARSK